QRLVPVRGSERRIKFQRPIDVLGCLFDSITTEQSFSQIVLCFEITRIELDGCAKVFFGSASSTALDQICPEIVVGQPASRILEHGIAPQRILAFINKALFRAYA